MNANLVSFGSALCDVAKQLCVQVLRWNSASPSTVDTDAILANTTFTSAKDYDVKDLDRELAQMQIGFELNLGPTAEKALRKSARDRLVTLSKEDLEESDKELELIAATEINADMASEEIPSIEHMQEVSVDELLAAK